MSIDIEKARAVIVEHLGVTVSDVAEGSELFDLGVTDIPIRDEMAQKLAEEFGFKIEGEQWEAVYRLVYLAQVYDWIAANAPTA